MEAVLFLAPAFAACLVIASIHVYLGNHVLARGVIFVDLSLAQVAALGSTLAAWRGHEFGGLGNYIASLLFAMVGAALFAVTRSREAKERVPQEATIGIVYAVAASMVVVVASRLPHGGEEIERLLIGSVLWVQWPVVARTAGIYAVIGLIHYLLRKPLLLISRDHLAAYAQGLPVRLLDFCFYTTFALVITQSVPIAGVLLVFSFLVVPAAAGALLADGLAGRLVAGWAVAIAASVLGLAGSWSWDLPLGAAIVSAFGLLLLVVALLRLAAGRRPSRSGGELTPPPAPAPPAPRAASIQGRRE